MDLLELIKTRRSIRKFKSNKIGEEVINKLIEAAMYAPSARNQQSRIFIVLDKKEILNDLSDIHPHAKMLANAPLAIMICSDENLEQSSGYWVQDCAASTQNLLLMAHSLGIGSVWLGVYPREERVRGLREYFNLPENIKPLSLIALGYHDENISTPERFNKERIYFNKY